MGELIVKVEDYLNGFYGLSCKSLLLSECGFLFLQQMSHCLFHSPVTLPKSVLIKVQTIKRDFSRTNKHRHLSFPFSYSSQVMIYFLSSKAHFNQAKINANKRFLSLARFLLTPCTLQLPPSWRSETLN